MPARPAPSRPLTPSPRAQHGHGVTGRAVFRDRRQDLPFVEALLVLVRQDEDVELLSRALALGPQVHHAGEAAVLFDARDRRLDPDPGRGSDDRGDGEGWPVARSDPALDEYPGAWAALGAERVLPLSRDPIALAGREHFGDRRFPGRIERHRDAGNCEGEDERRAREDLPSSYRASQGRLTSTGPIQWIGRPSGSVRASCSSRSPA